MLSSCKCASRNERFVERRRIELNQALDPFEAPALPFELFYPHSVVPRTAFGELRVTRREPGFKKHGLVAPL